MSSPAVPGTSTSTRSAEPAVLIAGAGPTGLVLALQLARRGIPFRLISAADGPGEHSRAMVVQARTLEFYDQLGIAEAVIEQGVIARRAHLMKNGQPSVSFSFEDLGGGSSPFPFALAYAQDDHERFLLSRVEELGGSVDWATELTGFTQDGDGITAILRCRGEEQTVRARFLAGCDGAHSRVREAAGIGFPGGTYEQRFFVADVQIDTGFQRDLFFALGRRLLVLMFPVRLSGMQRLIGLIPPEFSSREDLTFEDIRPSIEPLLGIRVTAVNWFSPYRVHHRVAETFRAGRAFLLGDAGHIHSPVGGQGMNTGIGDAVNLAWKLADVLKGRAGTGLLDTYEPERIGFARSLVATTDRAFTPITAEGLGGDLVRRVLAPFLFATATRFTPTRHAIFRLVSQTGIHYRESALSEGHAGKVHGGDRLPWMHTASTDNFAPLRSLDWQMHLYGRADAAFAAGCRQHGLAVHVFPWGEAAEKAGLQQNAAYLVRPDGYVALADATQNRSALHDFLGRFDYQA